MLGHRQRGWLDQLIHPIGQSLQRLTSLQTKGEPVLLERSEPLEVASLNNVILRKNRDISSSDLCDGKQSYKKYNARLV